MVLSLLLMGLAAAVTAMVCALLLAATGGRHLMTPKRERKP